MATERKVCCLCLHEGHRSHACTRPREPYRLAPINGTPDQQYSAAKASWLAENPGATSEEIEDESRRLAERLGV